jgi:hypothetical protein
MKTKMTAATITLLFLVGMLTMAFNAHATFVQGELTTVPLWTWSDGTNVGTVTVAIMAHHEIDLLIVTLETTDGWLMYNTHLYVETTPPPWSFPFPLDDPLFIEWDVGGGAWTEFWIPLADLGVECGDTLYIITHAQVSMDALERDAWGQEDPREIGWKKYFSVTIPCEEREGCTPGFWKRHTDMWPDGLVPDTLLSDVGFNWPNTFMGALKYHGGRGLEGAARTLMRTATAAYLNALHPDVNYPWGWRLIVDETNEALASGDRDTMLNLAGEFDRMNNLGATFP